MFLYNNNNSVERMQNGTTGVIPQQESNKASTGSQGFLVSNIRFCILII